MRSIVDHLGIAGVLLAFGLFWSVAGVLLTPTMKFYSWLLTAFVYLPGFYLVARYFSEFRHTVLNRRELWLFLLLFLWSLISLSWSHDAERYLTIIKREVFFLLLILGWIVWGRTFNRPLQAMMIIWGGMAGIYSLAALIAYPMRSIDRMYGFGGFMDNPNPAGYTIAALIVLSCTWWPQKLSGRVIWAVLQACSVAFVILTGSRGAMVSLMAVAAVVVLLGGGRFYRVLGVLALAAAVVFAFLEPSLFLRGDSERSILIRGAIDLIQQRPWLGIGLSSDYEVSAGGVVYGHCHNMILDTAVQYGVPFTVLWVWLWFWLGLRAWRHRAEALGMTILMIWVFATVAQQFDVFTVFGRARAMWMVVWMPFVLSLCLGKSEKKPVVG
ncbi:O-antigen ligase [Pseudomonas sp. NFACC02]|uniref:O-antigen ligase family protein n=1 Tax=Pseudomonas sp. NFACC02 TaxID=1566250 RepID=UPI0008C4ABB6|nr:O-antigen ligase family protein [Pseudomonas sp. NFACC02]SER01348.1 O-antigen ligase [Pseudomonas sp. NFACC02]